MNDLLIEKLLRETPAPKAPADLGEKLIADIRLTRTEAGGAGWNARPSWFRRWLPGLSFGASALACLAIIGVQVNQLSELRRENETLRAQNQNLAALRGSNAEVQRLRNENADLYRLRKNNAEIQRLRDQIGQLRAQTEGLAALRTENQRLKAAATGAPGAKPDFFADLKDQAERVSCVNNLKILGMALRVWANDHDGQFPADFGSMTNEIQSWKYLQCPGDKSRHISSWAQVASGDVSYQSYMAGLSTKDDSSIVVFECPSHHIVGLLDGSVQQLTEESYKQRVKIVDGRKVYVK